MADWSPISTAPRDTRDLLVYLSGGRQLVARWHDPSAAFVAIDARPLTPIAWQPLPDPPPPAAPEPPPTPVIAAINPSSAVLGSPSFTLHVVGSGFTADAAILWNGTPEPTTVESSTELTTEVDMSTAEVAIEIPVAVAQGGVVSNAFAFTLTEG
jgi:hypothetical protein